MQKKLLLDESLVSITINRLCQQLIENHDDFSNSVLIGLQPRGVFLARKIKEQLEIILQKEIPLGLLDITFFRDDFRRRSKSLEAKETDIPFLIEDKKVILIDDVLFTGRSVRSALDAMNAYGRPQLVELLVLIERKYTRDLPIQPNYIGKSINSMLSQRVLVDWATPEDVEKDSVWLLNKESE
jgi:pyrimidine operon attenuation protein/uracil phosphoribosyltransferase